MWLSVFILSQCDLYVLRHNFLTMTFLFSTIHAKQINPFVYIYEQQQSEANSVGKLAPRIGDGPILTLERVERQQAGVYQCTADNNVGEPVTVDMRLDVLCK